jgi:exosome complex component CSL4
MAAAALENAHEIGVTLRYRLGDTVVPGDRLGTIKQVCPGPGTCLKENGHVYASLVGRLRVERTAKEPQEEDDDDVEMTDEALPEKKSSDKPPFTCSVVSTKPPATAQVLQVGQIVVGTVVRISPQMAVVEIKIVQGTGVLKSFCEGCIRVEDIRGTVHAETSMPISDCFRPNDVVACRIVSLGDPRRYFLSTAETELGVLRAYSKHTSIPNTAMIPVSWKEMECPVTGKREQRKCAKPIALQQGQS